MKFHRKDIFRFFLLVILPIVAGTIIYLLFSPSRRFFFQFLPEFPFHYPFHNFISYSLPDGLWSFALVSFTALLVGKRSAFSLMAFISGTVLELLQWIHFIPGTFDGMDVAFSILSGIIALLITETKFHLPSIKFKRVAGFVGCTTFLFMALANEPTDTCTGKETVIIKNTTDHPLFIVEKGKTTIRIDSGVTNFHISYNSPDTETYYLFAFNRSSSDYMEQRYPGILDNGIRDAPRKEVDKWLKEGKLTSFSFFMDKPTDTSAYHRVYVTCDTLQINTVGFWIEPHSDFSYWITIPDTSCHAYMVNEDFYPDYSFYFTNKNGNPDSLKLRSSEFYGHLNNKNELVFPR